MGREIELKVRRKRQPKLKNGKLDMAKVTKNPILKRVWDQDVPAPSNFAKITAELIKEYLPAGYSPPEPYKLRPCDKAVCEKLVKAFGDDYKRMAKDVTINRWQWSAKKCEMLIKCRNN